jgi:hypothetical protein
VSTSTVPPTNQTTSFETQMIPMTPQVLRRTLSVCCLPQVRSRTGTIVRAIERSLSIEEGNQLLKRLDEKHK